MSGPPRPGPVTLGDVAKAVGATLVGPPDVSVSDLSSLDEAGPTDLAYVTADRFVPSAVRSRAAAFLVARHLPEIDRPQLVVANPSLAAARVIERFFVEPYRPRGIAEPIARGRDVQIGPDASIWPFVTLGDRVVLGARVTLYPGVFVGDDCTIGDDCVLHPNVSVARRCQLGARVVVAAGSVIGSDGFGYVQHEDRHHKIPQRGIVVIEDDVELGANVTVDVATFGRTVIGRGTKIDNQVHIAHNVSIGEHSILVGQVGIAGSTTLGHHVVVGGQAGLADHVTVGDRALIAAGAGVFQRVEPGQMVSGNPAMPHADALKAYGLIRHLPDLRGRLRELQKRVAALEATAAELRRAAAEPPVPPRPRRRRAPPRRRK